MKCPNRKATQGQVKNGWNPSDTQKYRCNECKTVYTPDPKLNGYPPETQLLAIRMYYGAPYELRPDKQETYAVEAVNADLRHCLKRLARRSHCFSRRLQALLENLRLFVYCYNHRQLAKRQFPKYAFHLVDFVSLPV